MEFFAKTKLSERVKPGIRWMKRVLSLQDKNINESEKAARKAMSPFNENEYTKSASIGVSDIEHIQKKRFVVSK